MTKLIYGIIANTQGLSIPHGETGVEGQPLHVVAHNVHGAVCSEMSAPAPPVTVDDIKVFNAAIQHLADQIPTIPMRYGCVFEDDKRIVDYLAQHRKTNDVLLKRIRGCVEMSIRIAHAGSHPIADAAGDGDACKTFPPSGRSYLNHRRKYYTARDQNKTAIEAVALFHQQPFEGLYKEVRREVSTAGADVLPPIDLRPWPSGFICLHFLVPHSAIEDFTATFNSLDHTSTHNLYLSGPWPPYNFVMNDGNDAMMGLTATG